MRIGRMVLVLIALLLVGTVASASCPDSITNTTSMPWVAAGSTDVAIIEVTVYNATTGGMSDAPVAFSVNPSMGTVVALSATTDASGSVWAQFSPSTRSGIAQIQVRVYCTGSDSGYKDFIILQNVDHAPPAAYKSLYNPQLAAADTTVEFLVQLKDAYGNIVDSRREESELRSPESIVFTDAGSGNGGFWSGNGYVHTYVSYVNATGYFSVTYKLPSVAGDNIIQISAPATVTPWITFFVITGYGVDATSISSVVNPPTYITYADGISFFVITYTVRDRNGNPVPNTIFTQTTSLGETQQYITNDEGQAAIPYGPKTSLGTVIITATVNGNSMAHTTDTVQFVHSGPAMWELTANPQTLASREIKPDITAAIQAKVMDVLGHPCDNVTVTFTILRWTNTTRLVAPPSIDNATGGVVTALTNSNGFALATFRPGQFPLLDDTGYNQTALGSATVQASWAGQTKTILMDFRNYPYIRVNTNITPQTLHVNETADVTIQLIGDGWALQPKPIDASLVFDRSGSMGYDSPTRISQAQKAANIFIDQMNPSTDRLGLVSFSSTTSLDQSLTTSFSSVRSKINATTANGATQLRMAAYTGITDLKTNGRSSAVRAVIMMTDGEWNYDGSPLGHGTGWPANNTGYTFSGNTMEPNNYRWYDGLGGTLTTTSCAQQGCINQTCTQQTCINQTCINQTCIHQGCLNQTCTHQTCTHQTCTQQTCTRYVWSWCVQWQCTQYTCDQWQCDQYTCNQYGCDQYQCNQYQCNQYRCDQYTCNQYGCLQSNQVCYDGESHEQNLSIYAKDNNVRLYAIAFAQQLDPVAVSGLQTLANNTGGFYIYAPNGTALADAYRKIAGDLRTLAGVNTQMNLSFQNVNVSFNNMTNLTPGQDVFDYQYVNGVSTNITSWNSTANPLPSHIPPYPYTLDQTSDWSQTPPQLNFNAGNISINQTWQATFRLKVKIPGSISIFGPGSLVSFGDGVTRYTLTMPDTFITALANMTTQNATQSYLDIHDLTCTNYNGPNTITELLTMQWILKYTGNQTVRQDAYYQFSHDNVVWSDWTKFETVPDQTGPLTDVPQTANLDVRGMNGFIKFRVTAREQIGGGAYDKEEYGPIAIGLNIPSIKLI